MIGHVFPDHLNLHCSHSVRGVGLLEGVCLTVMLCEVSLRDLEAILKASCHRMSDFLGHSCSRWADVANVLCHVSEFLMFLWLLLRVAQVSLPDVLII